MTLGQAENASLTTPGQRGVWIRQFLSPVADGDVELTDLRIYELTD
jgi:hypothetical protein